MVSLAKKKKKKRFMAVLGSSKLTTRSLHNTGRGYKFKNIKKIKQANKLTNNDIIYYK